MKLYETYKPYLPALLTFLGATAIASGIYIGDARGGNLLRLGGAIVAALGALWAGHRQIKSSEANKEKDAKLLAQAEELRSYVTGGDSFCYGYPMNVNSPHFQWTFIHSGKYPLLDVQVRIHSFRKPITQSSVMALGTVLPGRSHSYGLMPGSLEEQAPSQAFNLFFTARNGSWTQEIRWVNLPGSQSTANRVLRDGDKLESPLLLEISDDYPDPDGLPADDAWNKSPPGLQRVSI